MERELFKKPKDENWKNKIYRFLGYREKVPGTIDALSIFLQKEPQKDDRGSLRYLLTGGLAVQIITGFERSHHDLDIVIMNPKNNWWKKYAIDGVTPDNNWAGMNFNQASLERTAWNAQIHTSEYIETVATVHPAIIWIQKLSNALGKPPREEDVKDVVSIVAFWQRTQTKDPGWYEAMSEALKALPKEEQTRTKERLSQNPNPLSS